MEIQEMDHVSTVEGKYTSLLVIVRPEEKLVIYVKNLTISAQSVDPNTMHNSLMLHMRTGNPTTQKMINSHLPVTKLNHLEQHKQTTHMLL